MNQLNQPAIGQRMLFAVGTLCAILLLIGGFFFSSLRFIERRNQLQQSRALNGLALIDDTAQDIGQMQAGVLRQVLASDRGELKRRDKSIRELEKINAAELADYQQFVDADREKQLYDRVIRMRKVYWERTQTVLALSLENQDAEATADITAHQAPAYDELLAALNELIKYEEKDAHEVASTTTHLISEIRMVGDILVGVAILVAIATAFSVATIARRLRKDNRLLQDEIAERKQAETSLLESEEKFHQLANNIKDVFWITSPDLKTMHYISPGYEPIWGRSTQSLYAYPHQWVEAILPVDRERVLALFTGLMSDEPEVNVEYQIARPDGTVRWVHDRGFQVRDANGKLVRLAGIVTDISARKRAEDALRESEERFSGAFEYASIGMGLVALNGRWLKVNRALCDLVGYSDAELLTRSFQDITVPEDMRSSLEQVRQLLAGETRYSQIEKRYVHARGHIIKVLVNVSLVRDRQGQPLYFITQIQDITDRKRIEARLRRLVDSNAQGVIFWNTKGEVTEANDAYLKLVGYTRQELEAGAINWEAMTPPEYAPLDQRALEQIAANGTSPLYEKEYIRKDGSRVPILIGAASFEDNPDEGVCFLVDLTERKRLEGQLLQLQKMETVGKLAGGVAHEFNSIMTAILGQSELLLIDLAAESPLRTNATEIRKAAERAAILTRQLLAYGRKQILQPGILDLNSILFGMEGTLSHMMGPGAEVRIIPGAGLKSLKADAGQIEQVIMNMALNAAAAMSNGGKLILETANVTFDEHSVGAYPELKPGDYVMLAITDTGIGMTEEVRRRVFEPFFTTKDVGQGTGLGLSICYGIIKQSGGHISVYSELARGTTFKVYLPHIEDLAKLSLAPLDAPDLPCGTETILLVEDDLSLREMAGALLRRLGYTVLTAANGVEALSLKQRPNVGYIDLLFTDVVMPHMNGRELADRVRALYPHMRILFTSAYTENTIVHQGVLNEGVALLQKPFTPAALAHKLREVLDQTEVPQPPVKQKSPGTQFQYKPKTP